MYKSSDRQPCKAMRTRTGKCFESKRSEITSALANGKRVTIKHRGASHSLVSRTPARQQTTQPFGLGDTVTLRDSALKTNSPGKALGVEAISKSFLRGNGETSTAEYWKDPIAFERWCREQGPLIDVNDADYAEPKLAVIS